MPRRKSCRCTCGTRNSRRKSQVRLPTHRQVTGVSIRQKHRRLSTRSQPILYDMNASLALTAPPALPMLMPPPRVVVPPPAPAAAFPADPTREQRMNNMFESVATSYLAEGGIQALVDGYRSTIARADADNKNKAYAEAIRELQGSTNRILAARKAAASAAAAPAAPAVGTFNPPVPPQGVFPPANPNAFAMPMPRPLVA